jgi:hypothetical protein
MEEMYSTSMPRRYKWGQLAELLGFSHIKLSLLEGGSFCQGQFRNQEEAEWLLLEAAIKKRQ